MSDEIFYLLKFILIGWGAFFILVGCVSDKKGFTVAGVVCGWFGVVVLYVGVFLWLYSLWGAHHG